MKTAYVVILVSCASRREAGKIARALVAKKLAACVSAARDVSSLFRWKGRIEKADESILIIKTRASRFRAVAGCVKALHSYRVPEIIALPVVAGDAAYLRWVGGSVPVANRREG